MEVCVNESLSADGADDCVFENYTKRLIAAIVACLVTVIGIPGNSLVILAVILSKKLQNKTNIFVVNVACSDLLTCALLPFQAVSLLNETWPLSSALCRTVAILALLGLGSSVINLALIAFIRYSVITKLRSFNDKLFTKTNLFLLVSGAWLVPFFFTVLPPTVDIGAVGYSKRYKICLADSSHPMSDVYSVTSLVIVFPSLVVIVFCYVKIYLFVRNTGRSLIQIRNRISVPEEVPKNLRTTPVNSTEVAIFRREVKVTKNLFIVVCTSIICVMPFGLVHIMPASFYRFIPWTIFLFFMNSCLNPIIYALKHPQFKEVLWSMISVCGGIFPNHRR